MAMEEPHQIKKLDDLVINKIAAGEIIIRPANALKEMIENSLDAKSTNISILIKNGGLKLIQIQDNGIGIRKEDLEIVCERFTTSKLRQYEDLQKICTYGFRGEALASISHVAHLTLISKTAKDICAYKALYVDGKLKEPPKPLAGNQGTVISVEDLFYNMNVRKVSLRNAQEEYQKIKDVVGKYAIHNSAVGFTLKKSAESIEFRTMINSNATENIRTIYGNAIARELIEFSTENKSLKFKATGYMTNVNYSNKKLIFFVFINHRLVNCSELKRAIDQIYVSYLPVHTHPFVYLSLEIDPTHVDVNVHPTKHEVHFLNEEQIIETLLKAVESKLVGSNNSRMYYTQAKLPAVHVEAFPLVDKLDKRKSEKIIYDKDLVRTDRGAQKLESFFGEPVKKPAPTKRAEETITRPMDVPMLSEEEIEKFDQEMLENNEKFENKILDKTLSPVGNSVIQGDLKIPIPSKHTSVDFYDDDLTSNPRNKKDDKMKVPELFNTKVDNHSMNKPNETGPLINFDGNFTDADHPKSTKISLPNITRIDTELRSVLELRKIVEDNCHYNLRQIFAQHIFVGSIDTEQALIQYNVKLYLCNTQKILQELFYQFIVYNFQNFDWITFPEPLPIYELILLALDLPEVGWTEEDGEKTELAKKATQILKAKSEMLEEYFSVGIDTDGNLKNLPLLLESYEPDPKHLPVYLLRLATEVNWETEQECFESFARETGLFYSQVNEECGSDGREWKWVTENLLYPAIRDYFIPPKSFTENSAIVEVVSLTDLYKVFERC